MENIRVLIAEDDPLLCSFLEEFLEREPDMEIVGAVTDRGDVVAKALELQPDVVLLDVSIPRIDGLEALRELGQRGAIVRVLVLTMDDSKEMILKSFRAGAKGFLPKHGARPNLAKAIRVVAADETWINRRTTSRLIEELEFLSRRATESERPNAALSERENQVLRCLGHGLTNAQIAKELFLSERTVKVHVSHILQKLGTPNRTGAALLARRSGLVQEESLPAGDL